MNDQNSLLPASVLEKFVSRSLIDLFLKVGLISFVVIECFNIFKPFMHMMLWSIILAVALYPLHTFTVKNTGKREGRAATILVLAILVGVLVPATLLAISFADSSAEFVTNVRDGTLKVPAPSDAVAIPSMYENISM